jgi:phage tail-like protein
MADTRLFTAFNFTVSILVGDNTSPACEAAFAECSGLEMSMQPRVHMEGGNNTDQIQLVGPVSYGQVTLKRGMTRSLDLWTWFGRVLEGGANLRASVTIEMYDAAHREVEASFVLTRCLPVKLRAPSLSAKDGLIAIEEFQMAYERIRITGPQSS